MLEVKNVSKTFRGGVLQNRRTEAVKNVSFTLEPGRTLGIMGNSGCGKTTLSRMVMGLIPPDKGEVILNGMNPAALSGRERKQFCRKVQMVFQNPGTSLDPSRKIRYSLLEPMRLQRLYTPEERLDRLRELLKLVGLSEALLDRYPHEISGGECQRLVICRSLTLEPELLVLDEPTSMLDVSVQAHILTLLKDLQKELKLSYLFISHNLDVLAWISHDLAVMRDGSFVETGSVEQVVKRPQHAYTRQLLDAFSGKETGIE